MRSNQRIKAVIFDLDDTLLNWAGASVSFNAYVQPKYDAVHDYLSRLGYSLPGKERFAQLAVEKVKEEWNTKKATWAGANFGDALISLFEACGLPAGDIDLNAVYRAYNPSPFPGVKPFEDTHNVLETLQSRGYKIGMITNSFQPMWFRDAEIGDYDLLKFFDARITSGDTRFMKPHPAIYWRMLGLLNLMPEDAIMIGDSSRGMDVLGAHNVGMLGVLMSPPHLNRDLEGVTPDYTIERLSELIPILEKLD